MRLCRWFVGLAVLVTLSSVFRADARSQGLDVYRRVSDPRGICRLDAADSLPVQIASGVGWPVEHDPTDGYYVLSSGEGAGIITHLWLMYYKLPADSMLTVKIWIDDSLVVKSYLYELFRNGHGLLRHPLDSVESGGLDCDVQLPYRRNFKVTFYADYTQNICCLFWAVEHRPLVDSSLVGSFRPRMEAQFEAAQQSAEAAYQGGGSPWQDIDSKHYPLGNKQLGPAETLELVNIAGPGMIQTIHFLTDTAQAADLADVWLRMYWDGSPLPSVDVPIADFFGCGAGLRNVRSLQCRATTAGEFFSYFPMPFGVSARMELVNRSGHPVTIRGDLSVSSEHIDRFNEGYFMAQFSQSRPTRWHIYHHVASALGRGRYIGMHIALPNDPWPYYLEGDPFIYIDSDLTNRIHYTGFEDYLNGGWFFSDSVFSLPFAGCTQLWTSAYRFHYLDAYDFEHALNFDLQHGVDNDFSTTYRTVAFLYRRWTPFWTSRDSVRPLETWTVSGSGYSSAEQIVAKLDSEVVFTTTAGSDGAFSWSGPVGSNVAVGMHRLSVNGFERPEPVWVLKNPSVRFLHDSVPHIFRFGDSMYVAVTGFKMGERISLFIDTAEVTYITPDRAADSNYRRSLVIRVPWVPEGTYALTARGDQGSSARSDTMLTVTRSIDYEAEFLEPIVCEAYTEASYLGYFSDYHWSNQYTRLFYPDNVPGRRMILPIVVPVSDTFRVDLFATAGLRYGNYDVMLDGKHVATISGYLDAASNDPRPSGPIFGGSRYFEKGKHLLTFTSLPKDPKATDYLLNLDNIVLSPTTQFHALPRDTSNASAPLPTQIPGASFISVYPNPLLSDILQVRIDLDSSVRLGADQITIELCDILGRTLVTVLDGTLGVRSFVLSQDCRALPPGKFFIRARIVTTNGQQVQTIPLVVQR